MTSRTHEDAPSEYVKGLEDLERRAARGEVTLAQARREIHGLRERYVNGLPVAVLRRAQDAKERA